MQDSTICAISTPVGVGGIAIVRISGYNALEIAAKIFSCRNTQVKDFESRKMYLGVLTTDNFKEKCLAVYFKGPYSYTGENMVEFQCHGGVKVAEGILNQLLKSGAKLAEGGEFTKRAFLNGKVSLDEAEGVIDIINSESESEIRAGYNLLEGNLRKIVRDLQGKITDMLAKIEVALDYPEEDLEEETQIDIKSEFVYLENSLNKLLKTSNSGLAIKNGSKIVILGQTNVGKSSIMNALLNYDRAIVTDIRGTTRDTIEETYLYKGAKFILVDTAGIRESEDFVEKIGIEKAKNAIKFADIVLLVLDSSVSLDEQDKDLIKQLNNKNTIVVLNKSDLTQTIKTKELPFSKIVKVSAIKKEGIEELKEVIYNFVFDENITSSSIILTNLRHINLIRESMELLQVAKGAIEEGNSLDLIAIDIKNIWLKLGEITGENQTEEIIDTIFSKFCVGK